VGIDHDTAEFAVESVRRWWYRMGRPVYPEAKELLITVDSGGSNGWRSRLWKVCLQDLADETGLKVAVCHFPPGTSILRIFRGVNKEYSEHMSQKQRPDKRLETSEKALVP
jgi:hypothetical protein